MNEATVRANASLNALLRRIIETVSTSPQAPSWREQVDLDQLAAQVEARLFPRLEAVLERVVLAAVKQELERMVAAGHLSAVVERRIAEAPRPARPPALVQAEPAPAAAPPKPAHAREIYGMFDRSHG